MLMAHNLVELRVIEDSDGNTPLVGRLEDLPRPMFARFGLTDECVRRVSSVSGGNGGMVRHMSEIQAANLLNTDEEFLAPGLWRVLVYLGPFLARPGRLDEPTHGRDRIPEAALLPAISTPPSGPRPPAQSRREFSRQDCFVVFVLA